MPAPDRLTKSLKEIFTQKLLRRVFDIAREKDVENGGLCDARSAAINFWSHLWDDENEKKRSELLGTIYVRWNTPNDSNATLYKVGWEEGGSYREIRDIFDNLVMEAHSRKQMNMLG